MTYAQFENLGVIERTTRIIIGLTLTLSILIMPIGSAWIAAVAFAAIYPLLTGLTAVDPIFAAYQLAKFNMTSLKKAGSAAAV